MTTPEVLARQKIDALLAAAGWAIQDMKALNLDTDLGVAVREFQTQSGPADYVLFVDRKAEGKTLDRETLDSRPAHESPFHAEDQPNA